MTFHRLAGRSLAGMPVRQCSVVVLHMQFHRLLGRRPLRFAALQGCLFLQKTRTAASRAHCNLAAERHEGLLTHAMASLVMCPDRAMPAHQLEDSSSPFCQPVLQALACHCVACLPHIGATSARNELCHDADLQQNFTIVLCDLGIVEWTFAMCGLSMPAC